MWWKNDKFRQETVFTSKQKAIRRHWMSYMHIVTHLVPFKISFAMMWNQMFTFWWNFPIQLQRMKLYNRHSIRAITWSMAKCVSKVNVTVKRSKQVFVKRIVFICFFLLFSQDDSCHSFQRENRHQRDRTTSNENWMSLIKMLFCEQCALKKRQAIKSWNCTM